MCSDTHFGFLLCRTRLHHYLESTNMQGTPNVSEAQRHTRHEAPCQGLSLPLGGRKPVLRVCTVMCSRPPFTVHLRAVVTTLGALQGPARVLRTIRLRGTRHCAAPSLGLAEFAL